MSLRNVFCGGNSCTWILFVIIMICTFIQMKGQKKWVNYDS